MSDRTEKQKDVHPTCNNDLTIKNLEKLLGNLKGGDHKLGYTPTHIILDVTDETQS